MKSSYRKTLKAIILTTAVFFAFYSGLVFQLLSVNRRLHRYSKHFQTMYSILAIIQGPLFLAHVLYCSVRDIKQLRTYKLLCSLNLYNVAVTRRDHQSDDTSHTSESSAIATINSLSSAASGKVGPSMNANSSYERHVLQWKKNVFTMERNEVYDTVTINI